MIPDLSGIIQALQALKALGEALQEAAKLGNTVKIGDTVGKLRAEIWSAQESASAANAAMLDMTKRIRELEEKVASFEAWEVQKLNYELKRLPPGTFVQASKEKPDSLEPVHYACTKCFEHRKRSILHSSDLDNGITTLTCYECGSKFQTGVDEARQRFREAFSGGWQAR